MVVGDIAVGTEVLVIGAGPGGYVAAIRAAQLGKEVTLVEREPSLGGICLNHGCIPSKALIHATGLAHRLQHAEALGLHVENFSIDFEKLQAWKQDVVERLTGGIAQLCRGHDIEIVRGRAHFSGKRQVRVETEQGMGTIDFQDAILATGSRSVELKELPFDGETVIGSRQALALEAVPTSLLVIGGGYIGLELGTVYAQLGAQVTVVELLDTLLPGMEPDLVRPVEKHLQALGVEIFTRTKATGLERTKSGATVTLTTPEGEKRVKAEKVLVAVGRRPNVEELGLEAAGIELDEAGFVRKDEQMRTSNPHVYAIGDVAGPPLLAHAASHEGLVAAEVIAGLPSAADFQAIPAVIFTEPEIATVGLTVAAAREAGYEPQSARFPLSALGRALTANAPEGFIRLVTDAASGLVLGAQMVGHEVSNLIGEVALAIELAATAEDLALTVHPHPTMSEGIMEAAELALGRPIHVLAKAVKR